MPGLNVMADSIRHPWIPDRVRDDIENKFRQLFAQEIS